MRIEAPVSISYVTYTPVELIPLVETRERSSHSCEGRYPRNGASIVLEHIDSPQQLSSSVAAGPSKVAQ
jgi:hypothetical protein